MYAEVKEPGIVGKELDDRESFAGEENNRRAEIDKSWSDREKKLRAVDEISTLDEREGSGFRIK